MIDEKQLISHLYQNRENGQWMIQTNDEHQKGVADMAASFAGQFGLPSWGRALGLLHDKGKERAAFQQYIRKMNGLPTSDKKRYDDHTHAFVGGILAKELMGKDVSHLLVNQIISHHTGLHNFGDVENILKDKMNWENETMIIDNLSLLVLDSEIKESYQSNSDGYLPITSKKYEVDLTQPEGWKPEEGESSIYTVKETIYMAYAAVKFDFTFEMNNNITIKKWTIRDIAKQSYLIPNITDNAWETLIKIQGQVDPKDDDNTIWVTDYKMPEGTALSPYESSQEINLKFQEDKWIDPTAYYLPETKNWISDFGKQIYMLSLTVESNGQEYELTPKQFPNLESLVRGTHVKVHAKISDVSPGAEGEVELEAQVVDWISEPEIKGDWEEVNSTTEIP